MHLKKKYTDLLASNNIPPAVLFNVFDTATIERGIAYYEEEKVSHLNVEKSGNGNLSITAKVQGNHSEPYSTTISYNEKSPRWITGVCTCPVRMTCKHAVASLFTWLERAQHQAVISKPSNNTTSPSFLLASLPTAKARQESPVDRWLKSLEDSGKRSTTPSLQLDEDEEEEQRQTHLLYLLGSDMRNADMLTLSLYKANLLKHGGYGKPQQVKLETLITHYHTRNFDYEARDLMIAQLLARPGMRFLHHWHKGNLAGPAGEEALEEILKTGRAFWASTDTWEREIQPLHRATIRTFQFQWHQTPDEEYRILLTAEPTVDQHFWINGKLWYIDLLNLQCGQLEHPDLNAQQVEKFLDAPPIPVAEAESISERLLETLPEADIPTPSSKVQREVEDIHHDLNLCLQLQTVQLPETQQDAHIANLLFVYGEQKIQPKQTKNSHLQKIDGNYYRIHRNLAAEQTALELLNDYGFESVHTSYSSLHPLQMMMRLDNPTLMALRWHDFLEHGLDQLRQEGWDIELDANFNLRFDVVNELDAGWEESRSNANWFEVSLGFEIDGERINLLPIMVDMLQQMESPQALRTLLQRQEFVLVPLANNRWVKLDSSRLYNIMETLVELYDSEPLNADGNLELSKFQGASLSELLNDAGLQWKGAEELLALTQKLQDFRGINAVAIPTQLQAELRPYQHEGVNWLQFLREYQFNGILADDMGLGKTLQTLTHLLIEKLSGRMQTPAIVIAPTSLMGNWRREAARFTPDLRVQIIHGSQRQKHFDRLLNYDLILTTYPLIIRDEEYYRNYEFHYLILDEAQAIKNATSRTARAVHNLRARHRLCLTGTPLENHLGELWSMYHFLMPGFLSSQDRFTRLFRTPIEKQSDLGRQTQLRNRVQPFMLRRTKEKVAAELPPKTEIIRSVALEGEQRDLYETVRLAMDAKVRAEINKKGFARSHIMILDALLKLRQVCCDPRLAKLEQAQQVHQSAKLELLMTLLPEMLEEGRKVLLFSQFTSMLELIEAELKQANIIYSKLTGQTRKRDEAIAAFQEGDASVFLISLKAGGTGLNLTAADTVIHYDPWWNPAAEQQATDRAYRIGQDKPVFVYKLITEDTVEEKILKLQEQKQALADGLYSDQAQTGNVFSATDLSDLLKPLEQ